MLETQPASAENIANVLEEGKVAGDVRLRFESVDQDGAADDANAHTVRTLLGYRSASISGWSGFMELEHSQQVGGVDDYSLPVTVLNPGEYPVIADPETTELDQAYVRYQNGGMSVQAGRQVITFDDHRFLGHVGWRQDRQTFDALSMNYGAEEFSLAYSYVGQRNRIFAEAADQDSNDHLINGKVKTPLGDLVGFAYLLETDNASAAGETHVHDTYGLRFTGQRGTDGLLFSYALSFATQTAELGTASFDADYLFAEAGLTLPPFSFSLSQERLGSDEGQYGFATPLATLHRFNGWADVFLATPKAGLVDNYLSISGPLGTSKWTLAWHDFEAQEGEAEVSDLGQELDLQLVWAFTDKLSAGLKYAAYQAGDAVGLVDTDKFWLWTSIRF
ncbi:hypothetical protein F6455_08145 [Proteobacteria bacterium 005FR1]|nr:hypothetical protein [Proteobacteria bacterium 005FR1]